MKAAAFAPVALLHGALCLMLVAPADCGGMGNLAGLFQLVLWLLAYLLALALGALAAVWLARATALTLAAAACYGALWPRLAPVEICMVAPPAGLLLGLCLAGMLAWSLPALRRRFG